jgi:hypothetical protein
LTLEDFEIERHCRVLRVLSQGPLNAQRVIDADVLAIEDDVAIGICLAEMSGKQRTLRCQVQFQPQSTELVGHPRWVID